MSDTDRATHLEPDEQPAAPPADAAANPPADDPAEAQRGDATSLEDAHRQLLEKLAAGAAQLLGGPNFTALEQDIQGDCATGAALPRFDGFQVQPSGEDSSDADNAHDVTISQHLEEITTDVLSLMRRMREMERLQQEMAATLADLQETLAAGNRSTARELDTLRRELIGERKHGAITGVSNELIPLVDRLRLMRQSLHATDDARTIAQVDAVVETLCGCLRRLGCEEFDLRPGAAFDPHVMQCEGYVDTAEAGTVAAVVRPGYRMGQAVLRPAGVTIGVQQAIPAEPPSSGEENHER